MAVGAGLLALPLAIGAAFLGEYNASLLLVLVGALSIVINAPHYAATVVRAAGHDDRTRRILAIATVAAVVVAVAAHAFPILLTALFTAYLTWSPYHYVTQNHGVSVLVGARAGGPKTTAGQRRALRVAHVVMALAAIVAIHSGLSEGFLYRFGFTSDHAFGAAVVGALVGVVVGGGALWSMARAGAPRQALVFSAVLLVTSGVWFTVPGLLRLENSLLYVGGGAALLHCAQYLWITFFVEGRLAHARGGRFDGLAWGALLVTLGVLMFTAGPWVVSIVFEYDVIVSLIIVQAVVNIHHFVVDAFVWKFRDPALAAPLFSGRELAPARRADTSNVLAVGATIVVTAAATLGAIDVLQLRGTRADADAKSRALALNKNDSRLWVQEAQRAVADNDVDGARVALGRAIALSPYNVDAQRALLRLHTVTGRFEEAWARQRDAPGGVLDDADSQLLLADVALRTGRFDDALRLASGVRKKSSGTPKSDVDVEARRIVGTALLETGKAGEARPLLHSALDDIEAEHAGVDVLRQGGPLDLAVSLARAHIALEQWDPAMLLLERALDGAAEVDRADIAVDALLGRAKVLLQQEKAREALDHLQRGLRVAESRPEVVPAERTARGWLDYGGLLAASDAPMRLRFVCAIKARQFAERMRAGAEQEALMQFITEASGFVEAVMTPADLEAVRSDVQAVAETALSVGYPGEGDVDDDADDDDDDTDDTIEEKP
jgi:tetratricopeptide (TPR) repeat protein